MFGNPYKMPPYCRGEAVRKYRAYARGNNEVITNLHMLRNKYLVCFCKPLECHGDALIEMLNEKFA